MNCNSNAFSACTAITALLAMSPTPADARVTQFEVLSSEPAYDGRTFGEAGSYERIEALRISPSIPLRTALPGSSISTRPP